MQRGILCRAKRFAMDKSRIIHAGEICNLAGREYLKAGYQLLRLGSQVRPTPSFLKIFRSTSPSITVE